jgi:hypothetical protein
MAGKPTETVLDIINNRMIPNEEAKKARGEVFTPIPLVREILYGLRKEPLEKGVSEIWGIDANDNLFEDTSERVGGIPLDLWRNPNSKWLDPANGIGNFPYVAFQMLDFQLTKTMTNKDARRKHIVEKMLFMIEIDKGNVNTSFKIFEQLVPGSKPNICCADTTSLNEDNLMSSFDVSKFDIVMGNPPFNEGGTKSSGKKAFYTVFLMWAINVIKDNGCIVFITPPNFHRIDKDSKDIKIKKFFNENNLILLRIIPDTKKYFDVQVLVDYYVIQKRPNSGTGFIYDKNNVLTSNVDISKFSVVPNFGMDIVKKLIDLQENHGKFKSLVGRDSNLDTRVITTGEFPILHLINADGNRIMMSKVKHRYQNTPKILINGLGVPYVLDDTVGKYGVSERPNYILNPTVKDKIFMFSRLFQYLNWAFRIQGNMNDTYLFKFVPDLEKLEFTDEKTMNAALNITDRIQYINKYPVPVFQNVDKIEKAPKEKKSKTVEVDRPEEAGNRNTRRNRKRGTLKNK